MASIAVITPDENRVVSFSTDATLPTLRRWMRRKPVRKPVRRAIVDKVGDWPFAFDRVYAVHGGRWRAYRPDDLPERFW